MKNLLSREVDFKNTGKKFTVILGIVKINTTIKNNFTKNYL